MSNKTDYEVLESFLQNWLKDLKVKTTLRIQLEKYIKDSILDEVIILNDDREKEGPLDQFVVELKTAIQVQYDKQKAINESNITLHKDDNLILKKNLSHYSMQFLEKYSDRFTRIWRLGRFADLDHNRPGIAFVDDSVPSKKLGPNEDMKANEIQYSKKEKELFESINKNESVRVVANDKSSLLKLAKALKDIDINPKVTTLETKIASLGGDLVKVKAKDIPVRDDFKPVDIRRAYAAYVVAEDALVGDVERYLINELGHTRSTVESKFKSDIKRFRKGDICNPRLVNNAIDYIDSADSFIGSETIKFLQRLLISIKNTG